MNIMNNPFYILGATPLDNRQKIIELAQDRSLEVDSSIVTEARLILTTPRKRIRAEISWFPGLSDKKIKEIVKSVETNNIKMDGDLIISSVKSPLISFNIFLNIISIASTIKSNAKRPEAYPSMLESSIYAMATSFENIKPERLIVILNEERSLAGIPEITELSAIEEELQNHKEFAIEQIQESLKIVPKEQLTNIMLMLVEELKKKNQHLSFIDNIIDTIYVPEVQKELQEWEDSIKKQAENITKICNKKTYTKTTLVKSIDKFLSDLCKFDEIMQPIQVSLQERGMEHNASRNIAYIARGVALDLANIANEMVLSEKVINVVKKLFVEINSVEERVTKDLDDLKNIKERDKQREKDITCKIEQSGFWQNHSFEISPKGIKEDGEFLCKLDDINTIRYGTTAKYTNGIYNGTDTLLAFSTSEHETVITWLDHTSNWPKAADCLWKAVGLRLVFAMANELARGGNIYEIIYDNKVKLAKTNTWSPSEEKFFKWTEVKTMIIQGQFVISAKDGSGFMASLSLQDIDNVHVAEALIRVFFNTGGTSISQALGITKETAKKEKRIKLSTPVSLASYSFLWSWFWVVFIGFILIVWAVNS